MVLAGTQGSFSPPSILDVEADAAQCDGLSRCIGQRRGAKAIPAIGPVVPSQAHFHVAWLIGSQRGSPAFEEFGQVFWVDRSLPPSAKRLVNAKASVLVPALIEEIDAPVGERSPYQTRERIDDEGEVVLHPDTFVTITKSRGCATLR